MTGASPRHVRVRRPGALTTIQDCGRPGYAHLGVPRSGALDAPAHHQANQLVGNPPGAAVLETTLTGVAVVAEADVTVAVTGAGAAVRVDGEPAELRSVIVVRAGQVLDVGSARLGVRSYVAFGGGLQVPRVLGSAATDLLSGLGPARLAVGDVLTLGEPGDADADGAGDVDGTADGGGGWPAGCSLLGVPPAGVPVEVAELLIRLGPRDDWLSAEGLAALRTGEWTVTPHSNRVGMRLAGTPVPRARFGELASEGVVAGAVEALPDGQLVVFLADHPTTGGYPVAAVVDPVSLPSCAQARPGLRVRFRLA
jgi:biotin-dependent carboxylase-like uncharacterized protein